jgi:hypothetical protein
MSHLLPSFGIQASERTTGLNLSRQRMILNQLASNRTAPSLAGTLIRTRRLFIRPGTWREENESP